VRELSNDRDLPSTVTSRGKGAPSSCDFFVRGPGRFGPVGFTSEKWTLERGLVGYWTVNGYLFVSGLLGRLTELFSSARAFSFARRVYPSGSQDFLVGRFAVRTVRWSAFGIALFVRVARAFGFCGIVVLTTVRFRSAILRPRFFAAPLVGCRGDPVRFCARRSGLWLGRIQNGSNDRVLLAFKGRRHFGCVQSVRPLVV